MRPIECCSFRGRVTHVMIFLSLLIVVVEVGDRVRCGRKSRRSTNVNSRQAEIDRWLLSPAAST